MLGALEAAVLELRRRGVAHALIGAAAMAGRGVMRSTDDFDLLVTSRAVLSRDFWKDLAAAGFSVEIRVGDDSDPLAGVVRLARSAAERALDVVVGRFAWQAELIERAEPLLVGPVEVPLALASDLVLLKLYAGAEQDLLDVKELLRACDRPALVAAVEAHVGRLPAPAREAWRGLAQGPG